MKTVTVIFSVILLIIAMPILMFLGAQYNKRAWDRKITELCEEDGGITVFERVDVSLSKYPNLRITRNGVSAPNERFADSSDPFYHTSGSEVLQPRMPRITRHETSYVRYGDGKILGRLIIYSRAGGDFPKGLGAATSFSCRAIPEIDTNLSQAVFNIIGV